MIDCSDLDERRLFVLFVGLKFLHHGRHDTGIVVVHNMLHGIEQELHQIINILAVYIVHTKRDFDVKGSMGKNRKPRLVQ